MAAAARSKSRDRLRGGFSIPGNGGDCPGICGGAAGICLRSRLAEFPRDTGTAGGIKEIRRNPRPAVLRWAAIRAPAAVRNCEPPGSFTRPAHNRMRKEHPDRHAWHVEGKGRELDRIEGRKGGRGKNRSRASNAEWSEPDLCVAGAPGQPANGYQVDAASD